ncbi:non-homologous end-joining factor 1 [Pelodytes ibericus]
MMLSHNMDTHLLKMPWRSLQIGDCSFLGKVFFTHTSYALLLSDLSSVWCEEVEAEAIQERSQELNRRLKAPISSFLDHLSQLMFPLIDSGDTSSDDFSYRRTDGELTLKVKSRLSGLPFYWNFYCKEASVGTVCSHFLRPLISMTETLDKQSRELCVLLARKDTEIQDYQESGAVLTRGRLKTEVFDERSFQESFLAQNIQELCEPGKTFGFSDHLQKLYSAVTAKKGDPDPTDIESAEEDHAVDKEPSGPQEGLGQSVSEMPVSGSPSQRQLVTVSKPKKRKAKGLFT